MPAVEEFRARIEKVRGKYPYLAAVENGTVVGYSYAKPFGERAAYERAAETVLYISESQRGKGIGTLLYSRLEEILKRQNIVNLYASIAVTKREDDMYLNKGESCVPCRFADTARSDILQNAGINLEIGMI